MPEVRPIDPELVRAWVAARSLARRLPPPVADRGGWRVDTGTPAEPRRYIFPAPVPGLRELGDQVSEAGVLLKLCGSAEEMRRILPARWRLLPVAAMMTSDQPIPDAPELRPGFACATESDGDVFEARVTTETGAVAAHGYAAVLDGVFIYDRIETAPAFQRQGLATALLAALGEAANANRYRKILVATAAGERLYRAHGWSIYSPYVTAMLRADGSNG